MKITQERIEKGQELYQKLVQKAWENPEFKSQLILNPRSVIAEVTNNKAKFADGLNIVVEDQSDKSKVFLNIPRNVQLETVELSEEQLDQVSGGGPFYDLGVLLAIHHKIMWDATFN